MLRTNQPDGASRWRPWTAWPLIGLVFATALAGRAIVRDDGDPRLHVIAGLTALSLVRVAVTLLFAAAHARPRGIDFGLRRPPLVRAIALTTAVGVSMFVLFAFWASVIGLEDDGQNAADRFAADDNARQALLVLVMIAVAVPLEEEFVFRGYVYRALTNWRGTLAAAVLTGVGFALTHIGWLPLDALPPVAVFGFGLCLLYHWTGSLYPCLALHAVLNSLTLATVLGWTWQIPLAVAASVVGAVALARLVAALLAGEGSNVPAPR